MIFDRMERLERFGVAAPHALSILMAANDLQNIPFAETQQDVNRVFNIYPQYLSLY